MVLLQMGLGQSNFASRLAYVGQNIGLFDVILPFMLVFALVYAIAKSLPFAQGNNKVPTIIALAIGMLFIYPHLVGVAPESDPVIIINQVLPGASLVFVAILLIMMVMGIVGIKELKWIHSYIVFIGIAIILLIYSVALGWWYNLPPWLYFLQDPDLQDLLIVLIVFGIIIAFVTSEEPAEGTPRKTFWEGLWDNMGGSGP